MTGATGFIGTRLCERLDAAGWEVHGTSRSQDARIGGRGRLWPLDLTDATATGAICEEVRPDVVFHLASRVTGTRDHAAVVPVFADTAASTVHLLAAAHGAGTARVVLAGSMEEPGAEQAHSPYAAAKQAAAVYAGLYRAVYGLEVVHLRIHMVYGPGQRDERKLVPSVIRSLLDGTPPAVSSGLRRVDWIHVDDVTEALVAAATVPDAPVVPVDVGTGRHASVREVVERLVAATGSNLRPVYGAVGDRPQEVEPVADVQSAARALGGWRASIELEEGLRRTVAAYRDGLTAR